MTTLLCEPSRYHCFQCKDQEIGVQGGYDLPKIINVWFCGAKPQRAPSVGTFWWLIPTVPTGGQHGRKSGGPSLRAAEGHTVTVCLPGRSDSSFISKAFHEVKLGSLDLTLALWASNRSERSSFNNRSLWKPYPAPCLWKERRGKGKRSICEGLL